MAKKLAKQGIVVMNIKSFSLPETVEDWRDRVRDYEGRGMVLRAYDAAESALADFPDDLWLQHRAVLALARSGANKTARRLYSKYELEQKQGEDIAELGARLAKDLAWRSEGVERKDKAAIAAKAYENAYTQGGGYYPAINAATLKLIAGDTEGATALARRVLADIAELPPTDNHQEAYYRAASEAEALLLLGDSTAARAALERAAAVHDEDLSARAVTRKQLARICETHGFDMGLLDVLAARRVIHYCGHMISPPGQAGRFVAETELEAVQYIASYLEEADPGFAYGSLACGADILFAEALLARGAELNVVLPFNVEEFIKVSVLRGGSTWEARFRSCLERATSVNFATDDSYLGDDPLFTYATQLAMGLALLRARNLDAKIEQVALWDGGPPAGVAGTAVDVGFWKRLGHEQTIIASPGSLSSGNKEGPEKLASTGGTPETWRQNRALLFGDIKGFSKLKDHQVPVFVNKVFGCLAEVVEASDPSVLFKNTWGDAVFLVVSDASAAARLALGLQEAMSALPLAELGLPDFISLRLGGHFGPVHSGFDPLLNGPNVFGAHVSRAARIEPITPPGEVYISEHFAAQIALDPKGEFVCEYVGEQPAAKGYGNLRIARINISAPMRISPPAMPKPSLTILLPSRDPGLTAIIAGPPTSDSANSRDHIVKASLLCAYAAISSSLTFPVRAAASTGDWAADDRLITRPVLPSRGRSCFVSR